MTSFSPYSRAGTWENVIKTLKKLDTETNGINVIKVFTRHFSISEAKAKTRWANFQRRHNVDLPDVIPVDHAASFLAYIDPNVRKLAPPSWKIWGKPMTHYNQELSESKKPIGCNCKEDCKANYAQCRCHKQHAYCITECMCRAKCLNVPANYRIDLTTDANSGSTIPEKKIEVESNAKTTQKRKS